VKIIISREKNISDLIFLNFRENDQQIYALKSLYYSILLLSGTLKFPGKFVSFSECPT